MTTRDIEPGDLLVTVQETISNTSCRGIRVKMGDLIEPNTLMIVVSGLRPDPLFGVHGTVFISVMVHGELHNISFSKGQVPCHWLHHA